MKLIAGLGNPGSKYENTRHNFGFMVVDSLVKSKGLSWRVSSDLLCYFSKDLEVVVIKPTTYVNKSGEAVKAASNFFKVGRHDILAVHDDLDLEFGKIRLSFDSISAGHKGIDSLIESLGGYDFARLRIGIGLPRLDSESQRAGEVGRPKGKKDVEKYVLEEFSKSEQNQLGAVVKKCNEAIDSYLSDGLTATMNRFN